MNKNLILSSLTATKSLLLAVAIMAIALFCLDSKQLFAYFSDIQLNRGTSAVVQGKVWLDENEDGLFDDVNESGVPNVLIKLSTGSTLKRVLSDAQGSFEFSGLGSGNYKLEFINPLDYRFVVDSPDSNVDPDTKIVELNITEDDTGNTDIKAGLIKQEIQTPTPIALASFELSLGVHNGQNGVHLEWNTTSEIETSGFYIRRSTNGDYNDAVTISSFIPSGGGPDQESEYEYWDTTVLRTVIYTYWLQEEENSGNTAEYGPRHINAIWSGNPGDGDSTPPDDGGVDGQDGKIKVYLPIVKK